MEYVKRSTGGNACRKSAYNMRGKVQDQKSGEVFSFKHREGLVFHEILLPKHAHARFKDAEVLWNAVEAAETRINSQVCREIVLALPDNKEVTLDHKIELARIFAKAYFVEKDYIVQIDIHEPHHVKDRNWHAHLSITPRQVAADGNSFAKTKDRSMDPHVCKGRVVSGINWGEVWKDLQNGFFKAKGLDITVDEIGIIPQAHMGPVRMRKHMSEIKRRNEILKEVNVLVSLEPDKVLKHISRIHAAFTEKHIDHYLNKHVPYDIKDSIKADILNHKDILPLYNKHTGEKSAYYTTQQVRAEEERILREGNRINQTAKHQPMLSIIQEVITDRSFSKEQLSVFNYAVYGDQGIKIIEGRAGTGKSYVMHGIREAYERSGVRVIGLTKDNNVKNDMLDQGFREAYTVKKLLFLHNNNRMHIRIGSIFMVDEAALLETSSFNELFKVARAHSCKVILIGDDKQQTSIERGGMFSILAERYGSMALTEVRRQEVEWQKNVSEYLSNGEVGRALDLLDHNKRIHWHERREGSFSALVEQWYRDNLSNPNQTQLILAHRNVDVDTINQAIRQVQQALGKVSTKEYVCETYRGDIVFAEGDRVIFAKTDKEQSLVAGDMGTLQKASKNSFTVVKDNGIEISFDPSAYKGLNLAYATTIYKAQGKTLDVAYVLHSPTMNEKQSYVSLTRQVNDVHLYVSKDETRSLNHLAMQMGKEDDKISSLAFYTKDEVSKLEKMEGSNLHKLVYNVEDKFKSILHTVTDRLRHNAEFYNYKPDKVEGSASVIERDATEHWKQETDLEVKKGNVDKDIHANHTTLDMKHLDRKEKDYTVCTDIDGSDAISPTVTEKSKPNLIEREYTRSTIEPNPTGENFNDVRKDQGRKGATEYFNRDPNAQKEIHEPHIDGDQISKAEPIAKAKAEASTNLTSSEKLANLTKQYHKDITILYKQKLGSDYKDFKEEIAAIAARTAQDTLIHGAPSNPKELRINFAKNQYALRRTEELTEKFISKDPKFINNWMRHHFKAEAIASIEGRMFADIRSQKDKVTITERKQIAKQASQEYEGNGKKLEAYMKEVNKGMSNPHMAKMYAEQRILFEERYGMKPSPEQLNGMKSAVVHGHSQYQIYQKQFTDKIINRYGSVNKITNDYIDQAAKYKAYHEIREILVHALSSKTLCSKDGVLPNKQELQKIENKVEKEFREHKSYYDTRHLEQQKQAQKQNERQNARGFER